LTLHIVGEDIKIEQLQIEQQYNERNTGIALHSLICHCPI